MPGDLVEILKEIVLYIPNKIREHFDYIKALEKENTELNIAVNERDAVFKRIINECDTNCYGNTSLKNRKIKELAKTFLKET